MKPWIPIFEPDYPHLSGMKKLCLYVLLSFVIFAFKAGAQAFPWQIDSPTGIVRKTKDSPAFSDHIEMSGRFISAVIHYGINSDGSFIIRRDIVWPMLRTIPNNTHASLIRSYAIDPVKMIYIDQKLVAHEKVDVIRLDGKVSVNSLLDGKIRLMRSLFPSTDQPAYCEKYELTNIHSRPLTIEIPEISHTLFTLPEQGVSGSYRLTINSAGHGSFVLQSGERIVFSLVFSGNQAGQPPLSVDAARELHKRDSLMALFGQNLILETPDSVLNTMFEFAKIRAAESIFETAGGPMHGPGGLRYYAAIWANDQAEYINPFFPFLGYDYGNASAMNAFRHFARFMNPGYHPVPSSIIAEGTDIWNGAGDRGDAAMIAYGATRFALASGIPGYAKELWPMIEWCLEFNRRKLNPYGVVNSDTDELEGRFPAGDANLCTSTLYYDALQSAACLAEELGKSREVADGYRLQADSLRKNIDKYFGYDVMGFKTYRYYEGNETLRSWICIPLTAGIFERKPGTIEALFSPLLWTKDGLATEAGDKTFWDRATLYALRGVFASGETQRGLEYLQQYSRRRLMGPHVPYAVEAWPEGNQRQLSAESALYCRIFTEGLFGIRPVAFNSFVLRPHLPAAWDSMKMRNIKAFGDSFDIEITRSGQQIRIVVTSLQGIVANELLIEGSETRINLNPSKQNH